MKIAFTPEIAHEPSCEEEDTQVFNLLDWLSGYSGLDPEYVAKATDFVSSIKGRAWRTLSEKQLAWLQRLQAQQSGPAPDFYNDDPDVDLEFV